MQKIVDEYAKITAQRKQLKKREEELRDKLVRYLRRHKSPTKGPFLVTLTESERTTFSWEDFARKQLKKLGMVDRYINRLIKSEKAKAVTQPVQTLYVDVNPSWKG